MKDRMLIFEFGTPASSPWPWWKPYFHRSTVGGRKYRRIFWAFIAVTYYAGGLYEYDEAIRSGMTEWVYPKGYEPVPGRTLSAGDANVYHGGERAAD